LPAYDVKTLGLRGKFKIFLEVKFACYGADYMTAGYC
jgi:hypothetical protein